MSNLDYICSEENILALDILSAHLHMMQALSSSNVTKATVHICPEKLSFLLYGLDGQLSQIIESIKNDTNERQAAQGVKP